MEITLPQEANTLATTPDKIVNAAFIRNELGIGRTKFYEGIKTGALPPPSFRVGTKTPRWFWSDVVEHLIRQQSSRNNESARSEVV